MIKLKEIIWEITPKCNKNCDYCGSKNILNSKPLRDSRLELIAENIIEYGVGEVTLSGGEPGTLNSNILLNIINMLKKGGVKVKAVTNSLLFNYQNIIDSLDAVGLSVNTEDDIQNLRNFANDYKDGYMGEDIFVINKNKTTAITNFGTHNIFYFDKIVNFLYDKEIKTWQIQLTMGKYQLNSEGIKYLWDKIEKERTDNFTIVLADNLQSEHECTAGIASCGISYKGEIIGCLSERSWNSGNFRNIYGLILEGKNDLKNIWEKEFKDCRFSDRCSCRSKIEYPKIIKRIDPINTKFKEIDINKRAFEPLEFPNQPRVVAYGVIPNQTLVYGVSSPSIMAYAVWTDWTDQGTNTSLNEISWDSISAISFYEGTD